MKRLALLLSIVALASCRDNRASLSVQAICFPTDTCAFSDKCESTVIGNIVMDISQVHAATLFLQVENQLPDNSSSDTKRLDTNGAHVNQVSVEYGGIALPKDVYNTANMFVPTAGSAVIAVNAVRPLAPNVAALNAAVPAGTAKGLDAKIRLNGYLDDGSSFETGEFPVGITVCNGCLPSPQCGAGKAACPFEGMDPVGCGSIN
jgi:hypothetical protein